jgi:hypothetical protein
MLLRLANVVGTVTNVSQMPLVDYRSISIEALLPGLRPSAWHLFDHPVM